MRSLLVVVILAVPMLTLAAERQHPILAIPITEEFWNREDIRRAFAELVARGGYGQLPTERAAFIVKEPSGGYRTVHWNSRGQYHRAEVKSAAIPLDTVAIAHTHPKGIPLPSAADLRTARTFQVPIFVLTPRNIYLVTPSSESRAVVVDQEWLAEVETRASR